MHTSANIGSVPGFWRPLTSLAQAWRALTDAWTASYRPEKHYMRGPGPKWHAKHAQPHGARAH
jgi:hypothetical protein